MIINKNSTTYEETIQCSKINYYSLARLQREGIDSYVFHFLQYIEKTKPDGFWIHLDVDVLDDEIMPAVDSRQPGGLSYNEINRLLIKLIENKYCTGIEITILDPDLDQDGYYTREFVLQIGHTIMTSLNKRVE